MEVPIATSEVGRFGGSRIHGILPNTTSSSPMAYWVNEVVLCGKMGDRADT